MSTAQMSRLEAVNLVLQAVEHSPVQALPAAGNRAAVDAEEALTQASRTLQSTGWVFNTEDKFPLVRQVDGTIKVPANALKVDVDDTFLSYCRPVHRGDSLYDRMNHRWTFDRDLTGTVVLMLEWDQLPQPARQAIAVAAARILQGRYPVSAETYRYTEEDVRGSMMALAHLESDAGDHNMLRDSASVSMILRDRGEVW